MRRGRCLWLLLLAVPAVASPGERLRWEVSPRIPSEVLETRQQAPLAELAGEWRQLSGEDADPRTPELYPGLPAPRLAPVPGQAGLALELEARGAAVLVASSPRSLPGLPLYRWSAAVETARLAGGYARLSLEFLRKRSPTCWERVARHEVAGWSIDTSSRAGGEGETPALATHVAATLRLTGGLPAAPSLVTLLYLELEGRAGLRCRWPMGPLVASGGALRLEVALEGAARGRAVLTALLRGAGGVARPSVVADAWAPAGHAARWVLELPVASLGPGRHSVELLAVDSGDARYERALDFVLLPSRWVPRLPGLRILIARGELAHGPLELLDESLSSVGKSAGGEGWIELGPSRAPNPVLGISCGNPPPAWVARREWGPLPGGLTSSVGEEGLQLWGPKRDRQ